MKREEAAQLAALLTRWANGEILEYLTATGKWVPAPKSIAFGLPINQYRTIPKPREFYIVKYYGRVTRQALFMTREDKAEAEKLIAGMAQECRGLAELITVKEVV